MLAVFAGELRELAMDDGIPIKCLRARGAGGRRARMLPLEMRSETATALLSVTL